MCLVAGDIFSAEDHARTWGTILTRAVSRRSIFGGKLLAAGAYAVLIVLLLTVSSVLSGLLTVGHQSLVGLSGNLESPGVGRDVGCAGLPRADADRHRLRCRLSRGFPGRFLVAVPPSRHHGI